MTHEDNAAAKVQTATSAHAQTPSTDHPSPHQSRSTQLHLPDSPEKTAALAFGRIDDSGNVFVVDGEEERLVGQFPDGVPEHPFDLFIRRYLDIKAQIALFETRLSHLSARDIDKTLASLDRSLDKPAVIGNIPALRSHVDKLRPLAEQHKTDIKLKRQEAKKQALAEREKVVSQAEDIARQDPHHTQWKESSQRLRSLLEQWKEAQRHGARIDRSKEDALWKRFSQARTTFDRSRRQFFHDLDVAQAEAKKIKEKIIKRAEEISSSTDWSQTASEFRRLMNEWKAAGRASRRDDDNLWERFWAAQNTFFEARQATHTAQNEEYQANLKAKEAILDKAEAILPVTNIEKAKALLRPLQEEWEGIGYVPKADMTRIESRMRAVEKAITDAEHHQWKKEDPEIQARAQGMAGQLEALIAQLESDLQQAQHSHDDKKVQEIEEALQARRSWLKQIRSSTADV